MNTFFNFATPPKSAAFVEALKDADCQSISQPWRADFFLAEKESKTPWRRERMEKIIGKKPIFFIPHTPYSFWIWDRWLDPMGVHCNFQNAPICLDGMKAYGYPSRVEEIGWTRCELRPFQKRKGNNLLYMPSVSLHWAKVNLGTEHDLDLHIKTVDWIKRNRKHFDRVTLHYRGSLTDYRYDDLPDDIDLFDMGFGPQLAAESALAGIDRAQADVVISGNTAGYISLASGYPTLLYNNFRGVPTTSATGGGYHWDLYKEHYEFPLTLLDMSAEDVLAMRKAPIREVEDWKDWNIGGPFDQDKFISVVREFV